MLKAIRTRIHLTPGTVIATLALVFAMTGGAYAASKYLITSTKQISPKVLKALKGASGKAGANGAQGPAGPAGATGPGGPQGPGGAQGPGGPGGPAGAPGKDGKDGTNGTTGFTETLPSGKTEKGQWSVTPVDSPELGVQKFGFGAISFVIPLSSAPILIHVKEGQAGTEHAIECPGTLEDPMAKEGFLCLYTESEPETTFSEGTSTAHTTGAFVLFTGTFAGVPTHGSWAVTAE